MSSKIFDPDLLLAQTQWLRRFAGSLVTDMDTAEDLTQDAMLAALRNPPDSGWAIQKWLRRVVQRGALQAHREKQRRVRREQAVAKEETAASTIDVLEQVDMQRTVVSAMLELDDIYSKTLALRFFEDLSYAEIAKKMEVSTETVRTRLRRGLSKLREGMDRDFGDRLAWAAPLLGIDPLRIDLPGPIHLGPSLLALAAAAMLSQLLIVVPFAVFSAGDGSVAQAPVEVVVVRWPFLCRLSDPASILSKTVAAEFEGRVRVSEENFASSELARREGLIRYPAIFVDGELFAGPTDFHAWDVMRSGPYQPWASVASRQRYADDLRLAIQTQMAKEDRLANLSEAEVAATLPLTPALEEGVLLPVDFDDPADLIARRVQGLREDFLAKRGALTRGLSRELEKYETAAMEGEWLGALYAMSEQLIQLEEVLATPSMGKAMPRQAVSAKESLIAFDARWEQVSSKILQEASDLGRALRRAEGQVPVSVMAVAQQSLQAVEPYLRSAHPFARISGVDIAELYIARAREHLDFARLCSQIRAAEPTRRIDPSLIEQEMLRIEAAVRAIFPSAPAGSSTETFLLETNSRFNAARDMLALGQVPGAWLTVLEAGFELASLQFEEALPSMEQLQVLCEDWCLSLGDMAEADSFDVMLLQYAGILVADGEGSGGDRRLARTILEDGLPTSRFR